MKSVLILKLIFPTIFIENKFEMRLWEMALPININNPLKKSYLTIRNQVGWVEYDDASNSVLRIVLTNFSKTFFPHLLHTVQ